MLVSAVLADEQQTGLLLLSLLVLLCNKTCLWCWTLSNSAGRAPDRLKLATSALHTESHYCTCVGFHNYKEQCQSSGMQSWAAGRKRGTWGKYKVITSDVAPSLRVCRGSGICKDSSSHHRTYDRFCICCRDINVQIFCSLPVARFGLIHPQSIAAAAQKLMLPKE